VPICKGAVKLWLWTDIRTVVDTRSEIRRRITVDLESHEPVICFLVEHEAEYLYITHSDSFSCLPFCINN
jgi:hypothetical protein